ncbi:MAG: PASTA domain-containing protein [Candidatus Dormibacteria bacterium]
MGQTTSGDGELPRAAPRVAMAMVAAAVLSIFVSGPVRTAAPLPGALAVALRQVLWSTGHGRDSFSVLWTRVSDQRLLETGALAGGVSPGPGFSGAYVALVAGSFAVPSPPASPTAISPGPVRHQRYLEVAVPVAATLVSSSPDHSPSFGYWWTSLNSAPPLSRLGTVHSGELPALLTTPPGTVPDVLGLNVGQALWALGRAHLAVSVGTAAPGWHPATGTVLAEAPRPGTRVRPGEVVHLTLSVP